MNRAPWAFLQKKYTGEGGVDDGAGGKKKKKKKKLRDTGALRVVDSDVTAARPVPVQEVHALQLAWRFPASFCRCHLTHVNFCHSFRMRRTRMCWISLQSPMKKSSSLRLDAYSRKGKHRAVCHILAHF